MHCPICRAEIKEVIVCDIVRIGDEFHYVEIVSPVLFSEEFDLESGRIFSYELFKKAVAKKYLCEPEAVQSKYIDGLEVPKEAYEKLDKREKNLGCRCPVCEDFI
ncbi:MAG: hypothetical protein QM697_14715 [Lachnospiraceae bacterium]